MLGGGSGHLTVDVRSLGGDAEIAWTVSVEFLIPFQSEHQKAFTEF